MDAVLPFKPTPESARSEELSLPATDLRGIAAAGLDMAVPGLEPGREFGLEGGLAAFSVVAGQFTALDRFDAGGDGKPSFAVANVAKLLTLSSE